MVFPFVCYYIIDWICDRSDALCTGGHFLSHSEHTKFPINVPITTAIMTAESVKPFSTNAEYTPIAPKQDIILLFIVFFLLSI